MIEILLALVNSGFVSVTTGYFLLAAFVILICPFLKRKRIIIRSLGTEILPFWVLAITGILYYYSSGKRSIISYFVLPVLVFMTGYYITNSDGSATTNYVYVMGRNG